jgi:periplasmic protein CpxP/Spy
MTSFIKPLLIAALLAGAGLSANAQPGPGMHGGGPMGQHQRMDPARMQERVAARQADLKAKLNLSPAQEGAWNAYLAAMQPPAGPGMRMGPDNRQKMHEEMQQLSTPERIDRMNALKAQRDVEMAKRQAATKNFYAALSPEQQKVFDANTMGRGHGDRHARRGKFAGQSSS